jgi:hypothetical protein
MDVPGGAGPEAEALNACIPSIGKPPPLNFERFLDNKNVIFKIFNSNL